jgi:hypothetical protein
MRASAQQQQHDGALCVEDSVVQGCISLVVLCLQAQTPVQQPCHLSSKTPPSHILPSTLHNCTTGDLLEGFITNLSCFEADGFKEQSWQLIT